jgi:signal transduction histidine kinase/CheY-like chemotaxis protein
VTRLGDRLNQRLRLSGPMPSDEGNLDPNWQLDFLFAISTTSWPVHFCVTGLATVVLTGTVDDSWPYWWLGVMTVLTAGMIGLGVTYPRRGRLEAGTFGRAHTLLTLCVGVTWGAGALLTARYDATTLTFYTLVLGGTALGAVSSQHVLLRSCMVSIWTSIPLLALAYIVNDRDATGVAAALMMLLFGLILSILALRMHHFVSQNVAIRVQLAEQVRRLTDSTGQLREAHAAKSRFLAQASHDLRQPIHAIGLFVECLNGLRVGSEGRAILRNIELSVDSLARLCRSLLDLSALDVGKVRPQVDAVALNDVLAEVVRQAGETAAARGIELTLAKTGAWVETDGALLHTMVQNLVSNAVKYAPGARVLVGARRRSGRISVEVIDQGPGIPEESQREIFREFVQLGASRGEKPDGLGLGLSIVERLAELMGLSVRVRSQPGKGSRFMIDGLVETSPTTLRASPAREAGYEHRLRGVRVLVVDDDDDVLESTARVLSRWGCSVQATGRVEEARKIAGEFDFLLFDHELGDGPNGLELVRELRARHGSQLPAAILTGTNTSALMETAATENISVMAKPVRPAQLRSVLLSAVSP